MNRPSLNDLTAFVAVATRRSFRHAADELGMAPSTLSHAMRALEERMGVRLLNRTTRSVSPTEAGSSCSAGFSLHSPTLTMLSTASRRSAAAWPETFGSTRRGWRRDCSSARCCL